jgi:hypothetical protein
MSQKEMFTIAEELFRLVREHSQSDCSDNCCIRELLNNLNQKKNVDLEGPQDGKRLLPF